MGTLSPPPSKNLSDILGHRRPLTEIPPVAVTPLPSLQHRQLIPCTPSPRPLRAPETAVCLFTELQNLGNIWVTEPGPPSWAQAWGIWVKDTCSTPAPRSRAREGAGAAAPPSLSGDKGVGGAGPLRAELPEKGCLCPVRPGPPGHDHACPIGPQPLGQSCAPRMCSRKGPALPTPL